MQEIELSIMIHTSQTVDVMRGLLDEFERQSGVRVNLTTLRWENSHADLNKVALYHHGPDVSEIGSTWVSDLIAMNALRPFSLQEIYNFGRPEEFAAESWKTGHLINDDTQWAIPWLAETFVIHYRRDLLKRLVSMRPPLSNHTRRWPKRCAACKRQESRHRRDT